MPYKIAKSGDGYKVHSPSGPKSKHPLTLRQARRQQAAIYANTKGK